MKISISGVRGVYGEDLNLHEISRFAGQFAGLIESRRCVIARDTRPSGRIIAQTVAAGLMAGGTHLVDLSGDRRGHHLLGTDAPGLGPGTDRIAGGRAR